MTGIDPALDKEISDKFKFLWEQYMKAVNLLLTLSTGSLFIIVNIAFNTKVIGELKEATTWIRVSVISAIIIVIFALISTIVWRITSQIWMEIEVFGDRKSVDRYLTNIGVEDKVYSFQAGPTRSKRIVWTVSKYSSSIFLVSGWICMLIFVIGIISK